jgi:hypothetical protein
MINQILEWNYEQSDSIVWPADTYDTLPDYDGEGPMPQIQFPLPPDWRSPFVGKSVPEAVAFMRNAPKPPKPLNTRYCAILTQASLDENRLFICKSLEGIVREEYEYATSSEEDTDCEVDLVTDSDIGEYHDPCIARVQEAEKEMINERIRKARAKRLERKARKESEAVSRGGAVGDEIDLERKKKKRRNKEIGERTLGLSGITVKEAAKCNLKDDYENVQLIGTSLGMISMFIDGVEHERWEEHFYYWREDQHLMS